MILNQYFYWKYYEAIADEVERNSTFIMKSTSENP